MKTTANIAENARIAARKMALMSGDVKNQALATVAAALEKNSEKIFSANMTDMQRSEREGLATPLLKRLKFDRAKLDDVISGLHSLIGLADPVGRTQLAMRLDAELDLYRVSCPIGVIGVIFESRPDALVQISGLALKSGNAIILKGGSEAKETNKVLAEIISAAGCTASMPPGWLGLIETRADVKEILQMDREIDLLIPRGSNEFVRYIMDNTRIPVLGHADGICHVYIDEHADAAMAIELAVDSKTQYVAVCNAAETILVHKNAVENILVPLATELSKSHVEIFGCPETRRLLGCSPVQDWHREYLDYKVSVRIVEDLDAAIDHINQYGSGHTDTIISADRQVALKFMKSIDSGNAFWNCSTRFSDGFRYGFGAEVGISTSKIHARGPVGMEGLMTYKYQLFGSGQKVADYVSGARSFTHETIKQEVPN